MTGVSVSRLSTSFPAIFLAFHESSAQLLFLHLPEFFFVSKTMCWCHVWNGGTSRTFSNLFFRTSAVPVNPHYNMSHGGFSLSPAYLFLVNCLLLTWCVWLVKNVYIVWDLMGRTFGSERQVLQNTIAIYDRSVTLLINIHIFPSQTARLVTSSVLFGEQFCKLMSRPQKH